jgi:hypothetical protein
VIEHLPVLDHVGFFLPALATLAALAILKEDVSMLSGGADAEIASMERAWFRCPRCQGDWDVRITNDRATILPIPQRGGYR